MHEGWFPKIIKITINKNCHFKFAFLIFAILSCLSSQEVASEEAIQEKKQTLSFDIEKTIRDSPMLSTTLSVSSQWIGDQSYAQHFEGTINIKTIFRFNVALSYFSDNPTHAEGIKETASFYGAIHLPLGKLTLTQGIGITTYNNNHRHSGPATVFQMGYKVSPNLELQLETENSYVRNHFDQKYQIRLSYHMHIIGLQLGYRRMSFYKETIKGPEVGLIAQF